MCKLPVQLDFSVYAFQEELNLLELAHTVAKEHRKVEQRFDCIKALDISQSTKDALETILRASFIFRNKEVVRIIDNKINALHKTMKKNPKELTWDDHCLYWHGRVLTGHKKHYCYNFEEMPIDETCPEFESCVCRFPKEAPTSAEK